jgi:hypothetical protein
VSESGRRHRERRATESAVEAAESAIEGAETASGNGHSASRGRSSSQPAAAGVTPQWAAASPTQTPAGSGHPLEGTVRREMEAELGHDLGGVRIHDDSDSQTQARSLGADAFTVGSDIGFAAGQYAPETPRGRHVLAHELTHVLQQGTEDEPDASRQTPTTSRRDGPAEREASRVASHITAPPATDHRAAPGAPRPTPGLAPRGVAHRFDSFEHIELGDWSRGGPTAGGPPGAYSTGFILLDCHARDLPAHATPTVGWPADWVARYRRGTAEQRRAITLGLTYGEIIAFSGDMYAAIDPVTHATSVVGTMERINKASLVEIYDLIPLLHSRSASTGQLEAATGGRYISLAQRNVSHFSNVSGGRDNVSTWREGHRAAIRIAASGNANAAWAMNAAADHFLTDAFAAGHMRPDRAHDILSRTGQINSKVLHDLDNEHGVAVHNRRGDRWTAFGDDHLYDPRDVAHGQGLVIALEAVARSKEDIQAALNAAAAGTAPPPTGAPGAFASEELVPIVDSWSANNWNAADQAAEVASLVGTELPEQIVPNGDTRAREWAARQSSAALVDVPVEEKVRMINRLLQGWVSDDDLDGIERLFRNSTATDKAVLRILIAPQIGDLHSSGQRARLRGIIAAP